MESIKYTPECVQKTEEDDQSALAHRDRVLEHFSTAPGLGPIDLVVCWKAGKGAFKEQQSSFFHQVLGHDLTSTASAAAYFAELCNSIEEVGFIPGLFTSHQWKVTQCVYCCFDAFSRLDVRCHMSVPGGVTAYAIDSKGQRYDMTTAHWKRVSVSAFLRYEYYHPSIFRGIPGVVHRQGVRTPDAEESILDSIVDLYYDRVPPEVLNMLRPGGQRGGALPEDNDPMLAAVLQHFKRRRVLEGAVEFFTQVASLHAPAVVHLCCALEALGRSEDALQVLRSNALRMPQDVNIICALAATEASTGSQKDALQLARHALMLAPKSTTALLCMARMQAMCGAPALSVLAMHLVVPPSDPSVLIRRIFPCGLPPHDRVTSPVHKRWPLEEQEVCILEEEMNFPKRFDHATNWLRVVKQLCGIADDGAHDELPFIPPDVHTDTAILRTSVVRLLPFVLGTQYQVITMCMKEVGMHNFMRILQALSRNATEKAAREAAPADPVKPPPPPAVSEKPTQKRRNKRATAAFKPLSARQRSSNDMARDPSWAPSQALSLDGSSAENAATGPSAAPTDATGGHSTSSLRAGSYEASTGETDAEAAVLVEPPEPAAEPVEAVSITPVAAATPDTVDTPVEAATGSARTASGSVSGPEAEHSPTETQAAAVPGEAEEEVTPPPEVPYQPPAPAVVADLSRVPADLVPGDSRARQQPDPEGHPVAEGYSIEDSDTGDTSGPTRNSSMCLACLDSESQGHVDMEYGADPGLHCGCGATLPCVPGVVSRSGPVAMGQLLGKGVRPLFEEPLLSDSRNRVESPPPLGGPGHASAVGEAPEHWTAATAATSEAGVADCRPLQALQDALQSMESGSPGVTAERLGRLQLRAQEHAARVVTSNSLRSRQFKKLQLGGARQRRDGPAATSEGQKDSGGASEDIGPVALKIVDPAKLQLTSDKLLEDAKQRTSVRHTESMQVLAALLVSTTAPPGAVQEVSMNVAHLVTLVLQDLDDAAHVHSAAVHETSDVNAKGLLAAAEHVQHNCSQFLQFQHHPLGGAALPDASVTEGATVGDWLAWAGACERLGCELHARYAYTKALVLVQPQRCLTANMAVARLVASQADIHTVFDHLTEVLLMMDQRRDQVLGTAEVAHGVVKEGQVSSAIIAVLATVIDAWGMSAVQSRLEKGSGQYHPSIDPVVEQAFGWGTDGCDA